MTRKARLAPVALGTVALAVLLLVFLTWRRDGLALLQLNMILC